MFFDCRIKDLDLVTRLFHQHLSCFPRYHPSLLRLSKPSIFSIENIELTYVPFYKFQIDLSISISANIDSRARNILLKNSTTPKFYSIASFYLHKSLSDSFIQRILSGTSAPPKSTNSSVDAKVLDINVSASFAYSEYVQPQLDSYEKRLVNSYLMSKFKVSSVQLVDFIPKYSLIKHDVVYYPCYRVNYKVYGLEYHAFVDAITGDVDCVDHWNPSRISLASSLLCFFSTLDPLSSLLCLVAVRYSVIYYPFFRHLLRQHSIQQESGKDFTSVAERHINSELLFKDPSKVYEHFEQWQMSQAASEQHRQWKLYQDYLSSTSYDPSLAPNNLSLSHPDTKGYYRLLGLNGTESSTEITKAFKALASKYHPDNKLTGDVNIFKRISEAHVVLKDDKQRKAYI